MDKTYKYAEELVQIWHEGLTLSGRLAFEANEAKREDLYARAIADGVDRSALYNLAADIHLGKHAAR